MKAKSGLLSLTLSLLIIAIFGLVILNRQDIYDWARLRNYTPPAEIAALTEATTMNSNGKKLFYLNWPDLQGKDEFNQSCTEGEESIVLGCYINGKGIFLYDVEDPRLEGVEEVTAAHEMLHSAYDRISPEERERIDKLTQAELDNITNERVLKTVEAYRKRDPSVVPNELHSIIATEVRDISSELENYYKKYFTNRKAIVDISEKYESEFTKLENRANELKANIEQIKQEIETTNTRLESEAAELADEYRQLETDRLGANPEEFNQMANNYNQKVAAYNQSVRDVSSKIDNYNLIINEYNSIITQESQLYDAIDSRPKAINGQ